jgi:hypothetical protein
MQQETAELYRKLSQQQEELQRLRAELGLYIVREKALRESWNPLSELIKSWQQSQWQSSSSHNFDVEPQLWANL